MSQAWTDFLEHEGARMDAFSARFPALQDDVESCAVIPLVHLALIESHGEDSAPYLHNLLSNDVNKLSADAAQWNSLNTPKGRMLASFLMFQDLDGHALILAADIAASTLKRMSMYVLRSKVRLAQPDCALIGVTGPDSAGILAQAGIEVPHDRMRHRIERNLRCIRLDSTDFVLVVPPDEAKATWQRLRDAGARPAGTERWHMAMIRAGLPLITAATQEEFVAQMLNFELIGGVSFNKGCYPGQEIVARTQYLGKLKKRMYRVRIPADTAPAPGDDVFTPDFGTQSAGKLVNVASRPDGTHEALAVMQTSCATAGEVRLGSIDGARLEFLDLPYALS